MLTKDSFLNNLPTALHPKQRTELEALGFALGSLHYSYGLLRVEATKLAATPKDRLREFDRVPLFVSAWAAVDAVHLVRQLIASLKPKRPELQSFIANTNVATLLRNKLDHIHTNLPNLAARKGSPPPLFGALTFIATDREHHLSTREDGTKELRAWRGYALHAGNPVQTLIQVSSDPGGSAAVESPIGFFELHAFDLTTNISEMYFAAAQVAEVFETEIGPRILTRVRDAAISHGEEPAEVLKNTGVGLVVILETEFADAPAEL